MTRRLLGSRWLCLSARPFRNPDSQLFGSVGVVTSASILSLLVYYSRFECCGSQVFWNISIEKNIFYQFRIEIVVVCRICFSWDVTSNVLVSYDLSRNCLEKEIYPPFDCQVEKWRYFRVFVKETLYLFPGRNIRFPGCWMSVKTNSLQHFMFCTLTNDISSKCFRIVKLISNIGLNIELFNKWSFLRYEHEFQKLLKPELKFKTTFLCLLATVFLRIILLWGNSVGLNFSPKKP